MSWILYSQRTAAADEEEHQKINGKYWQSPGGGVSLSIYKLLAESSWRHSAANEGEQEEEVFPSATSVCFQFTLRGLQYVGIC